MFTYLFLFAMVSRKGMRANNRFPGSPAVSMRPRNPNFANDYLDILGEYEAICETALALESRP
jgi:hypothetical protein